MWTGPVHNRPMDPSVRVGSDFPGPGSRTWRPSPGLVALSAVAAAAAALWAVLTTSSMDLVVGAVLAVMLAAVSVAGWRRRLTGGPRGLLISGVSGSRMVPWSQVRTIQRASSRRLGLATTTIEVDLVDDDLLIFGRTDLGADPVEVLAVLRAWSPTP
jgi:hypothetical protein